MSCCPGEARLIALLNERLPQPGRAEIEQHLEDCAACQSSLERLTDPTLQRPNRDLAWISALNHSGHGTLGSFPSIEASGPKSASWAVTEPRIGPTTSKIPEVPGYEILSTLGHGGMGVVYKARQHGLDRLVALKMIRGGSHAGPEHLARFRIEAQSVARLKHPHVVQIHDVGETEGQPYVALELLEGGSLDSRIAGTPQDQRAAAELLRTLALAVASAHLAGVVHRDLKSSNILFTSDGTPKITDFGLAKRIDEDDGQTQTGQIMGSPSFMAPEQANGQTHDVGPAADIYSLGAILYELLTGRPPFKGTSPMETLLQVVNDEPVPPSRLRSGLSRDLETICLKCLAKEPGRRYVDANALALDLQLHLSGSAIRARPTGARERVWKWVRRQPAIATLAGLGMVALITLGATYWSQRLASNTLARNAENSIFLATQLIDADNLHEAKPHVDDLHELAPAIRADSRLTNTSREADALIATYDRKFAEGLRARQDQTRIREFQKRKTEALYLDAQPSDRPELIREIRQACELALAVFADSIAKDGMPILAAGPLVSEASREDLMRGLNQVALVLARALSRPMDGEHASSQAQKALLILDRADRFYRPTRSSHSLRAECLAIVGDKQGANAERVAADRSGPSDAYGDLLDGIEQYHRRDWVRASACFESSLQKEPRQVWPQYLLALCRIQTKQMDLASVGLTACLQDQSDHFWIYLHRGFARAEAGMEKLSTARSRGKAREAEAQTLFDSAADDYRNAMDRASSDEERYALLVNRGVLAVRRQDLAAAAKDLDEAIALRPLRFEGHVNRADVDRKRKDFRAAIARCDHAIELEPELASLRTLRASLVEAEALGPDWTARAIADVTEAIRLEPDDRPARAADLVRRGRLQSLAGRHEEALKDCDSALALMPLDPLGHLVRVEALLNLKRLDEVISSCNAYLARSRNQAEAATPSRTATDLTLIRGMAHADRRDYPSAIRDFTQVASLRPDQAEPLIRRGWAYLVSDAPRLALPDFEEAVRLDPNNPDAWNGRGYSQILLGRVREAIADAEEAIRHGAANSRTSYNAARIYAQAVSVVMNLPADPNSPRRRPATPQVLDEYQDRSQQLLRKALEHLPEAQRPAFWKDVIQTDPALAVIRRRAKFSQLAGQQGRQAR